MLKTQARQDWKIILLIFKQATPLTHCQRFYYSWGIKYKYIHKGPTDFYPPPKKKKNRANKPGIWDTRNYFDYSDKAIKICFTGGVFASVIPELMGIHGISLLRMVLSLVSSVTSESGLIPQAKKCFLLESCKLANPDNFFSLRKN